MITELPRYHPQLGTPDRVYPYRDAAGNILAAVYRFGTGSGKQIRPYDAQAGEWKAPAVRPLYGLEYLADATSRQVVLVEGEKCADALMKHDVLSVASMGGSNAAHLTDWSPLQGFEVTIWPDNDEAGMSYAYAAARELLAAGAHVKLIDIHNTTLRNVGEQALRICIGNAVHNDTFTSRSIGEVCPKGWDVADAFEAGFSIEEIRSILDQATPYRENTHHAPIGQRVPANDNWPEPDRSFLEAKVEPPRFPLEIFPATLATWAGQTAESKSAPVDYVAAALITASASLIGSSRAVSPWQGWKEIPVMWSALVGTPSAGKSPAMDPVLSVLRKLEAQYVEAHAEATREYETDKLEAGLARQKWEREAKDAQDKGVAPPLMPARAVAPTAPARKRLCVRDTTVEALAGVLEGQPKGVLTYRDELAGWFASFDRYSSARGGDRAFWLETFGGRPYTVDRVKNGGPLHIPYLASSVLGGIQPDRLGSCVMNGDDDGLSARFLYFYPNPVKRQRPRFIPDDGALEQALVRLAALEHEERDGVKVPRILPLEGDAADIFHAWWQELAEREPRGRLSGWWGKLPGLALRLALVLEYLDWAAGQGDGDPVQVSAAPVEAAIKLVESYLIPMAERAHGLAAQMGVSENTVMLAQHILASRVSEFTVRELGRSGPLRGIGAADTKKAVNDLVGFHWLRAAPVRQGDTPGKAQERYLVSPGLSLINQHSDSAQI